MVHERKFFLCFLDLVYGASKFPCGWFKPFVVSGRFANDKDGFYQKMFFNHLLKIGFRKTFWQLVFPNQTAGLVKKIPVTQEGADEYHIRFYNDGIIDCELEVNRFNGWHWVGPRKHGIDLLKALLNEMNFSTKEKGKIEVLFGVKKYSNLCVRNR